MESNEIQGIEKPNQLDGKNLPTFQWIPTGQMILQFETPVDYINRMNDIYDEAVEDENPGEKNKLHEMNDKLIGKLENEWSVYLDDESDTENHNYIPEDIHEWIKWRIYQYLDFCRVPYIGIKTHSAWINDYKAGEYNPLHRHFGGNGVYKNISHSTGLIGMMALKVPQDMGKEASNKKHKRNGRIDFVCSAGGRQFVEDSILVNYTVGAFVVFPYDMLHCVYPHFNEEETRRTFPINFDVYQEF